MEYNELYHHGTKGMSWGKRLYQYKDGSLTPLGRLRYNKKTSKESNYHEDYKRAHTKKSTKEMSDKELKDRLNRLNMEKQYSQLSNNGAKKGKNYVDKLIKAGTTIATVTTTAINIYNNMDKIKSIIDKFDKKGE